MRALEEKHGGKKQWRIRSKCRKDKNGRQKRICCQGQINSGRQSKRKYCYQEKPLPYCQELHFFPQKAKIYKKKEKTPATFIYLTDPPTSTKSTGIKNITNYSRYNKTLHWFNIRCIKIIVKVLEMIWQDRLLVRKAKVRKD